MFDDIVRWAATIYITIGVLFALFHPRLDASDKLSAHGKSCGEEHALVLTLGWPFFFKYYYGGEFDACRESLFKQGLFGH